MHETRSAAAVPAPARIEGPAWNLAAEYPSISSAEYKADLATLEAEILDLEAMGAAVGARAGDAATLDPLLDAAFAVELGQFAVADEGVRTRLYNLKVYANCTIAADAGNAEAAAMRGFLEGCAARLSAATASLTLILVLAPEPFFESFCNLPETARFRFALSQQRKDRARVLPLPAERALATMAADGLHAWGALYDTITGSLRCRVRGLDGAEESVGLAKASSLLKRPEPEIRESAWRGINAALSRHQDAFAAILNAIAGWRGSEGSLRSHAGPVGYLDAALRQSRVSRATLDALLGVLRESREVGRRALRAQAALYGVDRLGPWDILAPAPAAPDSSAAGTASGIPFERGLAIVRRAYASVDPSMGEFVDRMAAAGRIEGRVKDGKRPGAFCTEFPATRHPFVYTTYQGALSELSTLAHELGHAYHCEAMRDMPLAESDYPMTLAETASTFAETVLGDLLAGEAASDAELLDLAWSDAQDAATFILNIPARFEFESRFYEGRPEGPASPERLRALMKDAWAEWYGDALSGYDEWYWASKLHFHKTGTSFYNFPYSFGYLFSLGVYARREALGDRFHGSYVALLRDTGRMEVEELALRHLGADLTEPDFWRASVAIVEGKVARFERLAASAAP